MQSVLEPQTTDQSAFGFERILGRCPLILGAIEHARRAAQSEATVLLLGESGTGKELMAEAIHRSSPRGHGPFVAVNMAALPETLVESELFGHVKGAFTGAVAPRAGRFAAAEGGTLFIDEIGDLKLDSQAKLLRVLERWEVTPVGSNRSQPIDVRVVAGTNRNLDALIEAGQFREDLYYRLNVISISLPPLRQRQDDILLLANRFLDDLSAIHGRPRPAMSPDLEQFLTSYSWPGNVRQLRNAIESMVVLVDAPLLTAEDLPTMVRRQHRQQSGFDIPPGCTLKDVRKVLVQRALQSHRGNRTRAAHSLGISVRTLQRYLKQWRAGDMVESDPSASS